MFPHQCWDVFQFLQRFSKNRKHKFMRTVILIDGPWSTGEASHLPHEHWPECGDWTPQLGRIYFRLPLYWNHGARSSPEFGLASYGSTEIGRERGACSYAGPKIAATELRILHTKNVSGLAISNTRTYAWTVRNPSGCPLFHSARLSTGKRRWKEMKLSSKSVGKHSIWLIAQQSVQKDVPAGEHRILSTLVRVSHKPNSSCRRPCVSFGCGWLGNHF